MAESEAHKKLILQIINRAESMVPINRQGLIMIDSDKTPLPASVHGGVFPDVYYNDGDFMIIGEAKTINDVDRKHSLYQYDKYIETIESFEGIGTLILCVHWDTFLLAQRIIKRKLPQNKIGRYLILSSNGKEILL